MIENIKENLEKQREELTNEIRSLENDILVAKEKYLKIQGAIEILDIVLEKQDSVTPEVVEAE
jgi:hypothetical protein